jgi:hypothetical protein
MSKKSKLSDADIKVLLDKVSFPCPRMTPPPHINQRCTMTPMENKMDKVITVTRDEKVYEIGKDYLFSQDGLLWIYNKLIEAHHSHNCFSTYDMDYPYMKEVPASENMGTITPAPVPLIHGKAYTFDYGETKDVLGVYSISGKSFMGFTKSVNIYRSIDCTNIRPMAVVETLKGNGE